MRERTQSLEKITCSSCGASVHTGYDEGGKIYCFSCAFSYGAIDKWQWEDDSNDEELLQKLDKKRQKGVK